MDTRRTFLREVLVVLSVALIHPRRWLSSAWAKGKQLLPKGFPKNKLLHMNPADVDTRNLDIDPLKEFGTMGPTDISIDAGEYRLRITGKVDRPLSLKYEEIVAFPSVTEDVLLICPGFFTNNGRWTGVAVKTFLEKAQVLKDAKYVDIKGAYDKFARIALEDMSEKRILLAYKVNGERLPQKHGFPLRLVYEDAYGSEWVKYVDEIRVS
jgi:DMSO/TMAO reductase YedYZ molybdopterin-dependent catalytic subunit